MKQREILDIFFNLEKRNYINKSMQSLVTDNGQLVSEFKDVLNGQLNFYSSLYSSGETVESWDSELVDQCFINDNDIPMLDEEDRELYEGKISEGECVEVIKTFKNGHSPGTDGLPIEFYKMFWNDITNLVLNSISYSYKQKNMSVSQKQSIITLLPKRDKDTRLLKNWRPISFLNVDYKIMAKCIASRLKLVLTKIISENQCGFMKGRYIRDNIRNLLEVIDLAEEENLSCIILSIDFEKAFDTISWKFLAKCLIFFNFGSSFQQWIKLFLNYISSCVLNTGWST